MTNQTIGLDLANAVVVGFFSLPSPSLAEQNPSAYNAAMRDVPAGAGSCQHCGTGILHHVVIRIGTERYFIGRDCANRVGSPMVRRCVRENMTAEQIERREADAKASQAAWRAAEDKREAERAAALRARFELLRDIIEPLEAKGTAFHSSLASQLRSGPLSPRQAEYAVKGALNCRYSKRVAQQWDSIYERCISDMVDMPASCSCVGLEDCSACASQQIGG
jgi:hypothetical protein